MEYFLSIHDFVEDKDAKEKQELQIKSAKEAWIDFITNYHSEMTYEEIDKILRTE